MPIQPKTWSFMDEVAWLKAHVENIARRHSVRPEDVCDALIEEVCA